MAASKSKNMRIFESGVNIEIGSPAEADIFNEVLAQGSTHIQEHNSFSAEVHAAYEAAKALLSLLMYDSIRFDTLGSVTNRNN